jgi:transcription factor IIIB subunit 2
MDEGTPRPVASTSTSTLDDTVSNAVADEVSVYLNNPQGATLSSALDEADERRREALLATVVDELTGLDEEELDAFLLNDEEVKLKERVWVELNKDYLEALAGRFLRLAVDSC